MMWFKRAINLNTQAELNFLALEASYTELLLMRFLNKILSICSSVNPKVNEPHDFDYDLVVIGGGSGGLAASKEAAALGYELFIKL